MKRADLEVVMAVVAVLNQHRRSCVVLGFGWRERNGTEGWGFGDDGRHVAVAVRTPMGSDLPTWHPGVVNYMHIMCTDEQDALDRAAAKEARVAKAKNEQLAEARADKVQEQLRALGIPGFLGLSRVEEHRVSISLDMLEALLAKAGAR